MICPVCNEESDFEICTNYIVGGELDERWEEEYVRCSNCNSCLTPEEVDAVNEQR